MMIIQPAVMDVVESLDGGNWEVNSLHACSGLLGCLLPAVEPPPLMMLTAT